MRADIALRVALPVHRLGQRATLAPPESLQVGDGLQRGHGADAQPRDDVDVLGHADHYPRFGFERASTHGITVPFDAPDDAVMAMTLDETKPLPTGVMHYAAPFGV